MTKYISFFLLPCILFANPFESTLDDEKEWLSEETFVISASKTKEDIKKSAASITVIDAERIEAMGANTLLDVLRTVPGMGVYIKAVYLTRK